MSFPLTPLVLVSMYQMLRECPPFRGWKLPESDAIEFRTPMRRDAHGEHIEKTPPTRGAPFTIMVSTEKNGHFDTILQCLAHEMVHLSQAVAKVPRRHEAHDNRDFVARAKRVCKIFGWDAKAF